MSIKLRKHRLKIVFLLFSLFSTALLIRLSYLQIYKSSILAQQAAEARNYYIPAEKYLRGDIVDRNGKSLLDSKEEPALIVVPSMIKSSENIRKLANILKEDPRKIEEKIFRSKGMSYGNAPRVIKYSLGSQEKSTIEKEDIEGVFIVPIKMRYGPGSLARHLVGHLMVGKGVKGIERIYDVELTNNSPDFFWKVVFDARGNVIPGLSFKKVLVKEQKEKQILLTIDKEIQRIVEKIMDENVNRGAVVVMNPYNGDILAAASRPNFFQKEIGKDDENINYLNKAFEHYYPGSIYKLVVAAAALEENIVKPGENFYCSGQHVFSSGLTINCWNEEGHGNLTFNEALALSCNSTFIEIALRLGRYNLFKYSKKFGLTSDDILGYPLPEFTPVNIDYGPGKVANASMGQEGIRVTPVQIAALISCIANGGTRVTPRVVQGIVDENGNYTKSIASNVSGPVMSKENAEKLQNMLTEATLWGTGKNAWIPEIGAAGKTGSAETGATDEEGNSVLNAWFAGYAPLDNPRYTVVVLVEGGKSGGTSAAPVFKEIMSNILKKERE